LVRALRRTRVGPFAAESAVSPQTPAEEARGRLLPAALAVAELPRADLTEAEVRRLCQGQGVPRPAALTDVAGGQEVAVFDPAGRLAAVATAAGKVLRPSKVLRG
jgi:tRNA U55 pseudouridine synthase TruB